ncbi:MAG: sialate O-acetylesterase [Luteolibacter sp.]
MKFLPHFLLPLLGVMLVSPTASATHYKLFVLTGQSNSLGTTNAGEADPSPGNDPADAHIKFYWSNIADATHPLGDSGGAFTTLQSQQGGYYTGSATHWGPEINFGRTLYRAGVRNFGIIKASRGGGGNSFWSKTAADHHMYTQVVNTVNAATTALTATGDTFEIAGLLYLQGESDSSTEANIADNRIKELVDNLRADLPNATGMHCVIGGIAAAGATRDVVRSKQLAAGSANTYIDYFNDLDLQSQIASVDNLHFNKSAKFTIGERFAQAFFSANIVSRQYGRLVFIGDSITQGGNGDHPGYRYSVFKRLAEKGVPIDASSGYKFTGSVTGPYANSTLTIPAVNGQTFENVHDGHFGWRASWECARVAFPSGRYNTSNLGNGALLNWTGQSSTYATANAGTLAYTGTTYIPDTASIMIGINDLADYITTGGQPSATAAATVRDDISTMIDQLRNANPNVRIHLNRVLHTNQTQAMHDGVDALNGLLPALVAEKNAASATSPVWISDASTGFSPATQTYDNVHPNASGESYVGDRVAASLGIIETPVNTSVSSTPPHIESGSSSFNLRFEGNDIWNGSTFPGSLWKQSGTLTKTIDSAAPTDLRVVNPGSGGSWIEGTDSGWKAGNSGNWTFETRVKFNANPSGFILWLGTGNHTILVEIYGDRTQDNGSNSFNVAHNNLDGQFHTFRIANDPGNNGYHVWRDGVRITPVSGAPYDNNNTESRLILGDYTSQAFGNNFDVTIDYVRYDQSDAYLPTGADADNDGLPDSWEYQYGGTITGMTANADDDHDGKTNLEEYLANTHPEDPSSVLAVGSITTSTGSVAIRLNTSPQRFYTLFKSEDLVSWTTIQGPIVGTDGILTLTDTRANGARAFYKVTATMP